MNSNYYLIITMVFLFCFGSLSGQNTTEISMKDFKHLIGDWKGTLTYNDYTSNNPFTMKANVVVKKLKKTNALILNNTYPDEPNASYADTLIISGDGKFINQEIVKSKRKLGNGETEIITEYSGFDGNEDKAALIRHVYFFGKTTFTITKEVQFSGQTSWLQRNKYSYQKI